MSPRGRRASMPLQPRRCLRSDQARRAIRSGGSIGGALLLPLVLLAACGVVPDEANPVMIWRHATGESAADRLPPPNLGEPYPNLGTVPPRPDRPSLATREAMSAALVAEREGSRRPLEPGSGPALRGVTASPGNPPIPAGPPPRAALSVAPRIGVGGAMPGAGTPPAPGGTPGPAALPVVPPAPDPPPGVAPRPSAPTRTAPAPQGPAPSAEPSPAAPPPPPPADLLAPGGGPPAPPPADLLAPPRGR